MKMLALKMVVTVSLVVGIKKLLVNGKLVSMNSVNLPLDVLILLLFVMMEMIALLTNAIMKQVLAILFLQFAMMVIAVLQITVLLENANMMK
jgi:hypothetical protein